MINGIIKLFYCEVVKTKMKSMPSNEYKLREECEEFRNITLKIDSILFKAIKLILSIIILYIAFNISFILALGTLLVEIAYLIYKIKLEKQVRTSIKNIKNNIEIPNINKINEKGKSGINVLITLLLIGFITGFNLIIMLSFVVVFVFTINNIYSNIK